MNPPPLLTDKDIGHFFRCVCLVGLAALLSLALSRQTQSSEAMGSECHMGNMDEERVSRLGQKLQTGFQ